MAKSILGVVAVGALYWTATNRKLVKPSAPPVVLTAEQTAEKARKDEQWQTAVATGRVLKGRMKNPDSFKLESLVRMPDGVLCFEYRATNSFNAIVPGYAVAVGPIIAESGSNGFDKLWKAKCNGKSGEDLSSARMALR